MSTSKHESMSSLSANPTDSHFVDERSESLTSLNIKADLPLSDSSDETENSAMKILDNLIEQLPKSPSVITKKNRMSVVSDLNYDQPHINVVKFDANVHQQAEIEAEYDPNIQTELGFCGWILTILSYILIFFTLPISVCMCVKVVQEYERVVVFRLGRLMPGGAKGPGICFIVPCIDTYRKIDLRVISFEVPPQEILSKDSVTVAVDAVVYFRISNATVSVTNVEDAARSTKLLAQTTLRNILGTKTLTEMLSDREAISLQMQITLDEATEPWGVKVERVEVKDVRLPIQLQRAMAAEAEAAREARAKVIVAEGEQKASRALKEAAEVIAQSPSALQLRYLQTLNSISNNDNNNNNSDNNNNKTTTATAATVTVILVMTRRQL
uniref:PHB domain-containing protein n=1 Tax=Loa loa TaxID=7209 RepID=A0A1I7VW56_LOALO